MKIYIHPYKKANLVIIYILFLGVTIYTGFSNNLKQSQDELRKLYHAQLENCEITSLQEKAYSGGRGTYQLFKTACSGEYYPVSPISNEDKESELFAVGIIISKEANSTLLKMAINNQERVVEIRHYESEDSRPFTYKVIGIFILVVTVLILVAPNSLYQRFSG